MDDKIVNITIILLYLVVVLVSGPTQISLLRSMSRAISGLYVPQANNGIPVSGSYTTTISDQMLPVNKSVPVAYVAPDNLEPPVDTVVLEVKDDRAVVPPFLYTAPMTLFQNKSLYNHPSTQIDQVIASIKVQQPDNAALLEKIRQQPRAVWLGPGSALEEIGEIIAGASKNNELPVFVLYYASRFPCSSPEEHGVKRDVVYLNWVRTIKEHIGSVPNIVILEPDALAMEDCPVKESLISSAVEALKQNPSTRVYIDAGHGLWVRADEMSVRLKRGGMKEADGFSLNVSNFVTTDRNIEYGIELSKLLQGKHFVIDTSRNGNGPTTSYEWCNPPGRALGIPPTTVSYHELVDAFLWVKPPGESDGTCNNGPAEGVFWIEYALDLITNSH